MPYVMFKGFAPNFLWSSFPFSVTNFIHFIHSPIKCVYRFPSHMERQLGTTLGPQPGITRPMDLKGINHYLIPTPLQEPNNFTWKQTIIDLLKACSSLKQLGSIYAFMVKTNTNEDCFLVNKFITACSVFRQIDYAVLAITQMRNPNVFVYNAMIRGFLHCSSPIRALLLYLDMLRAQICPTSYTFSSIVKGCTLVSDSKFGEGVHCHIWKFGFATHLYVRTGLIDLYANFGKVVESRQVFDEICERDVFAWTTMVSAYARVGDVGSARILFNEMPERNTASWNTIMDGYAKVGDIKTAALLFDEMPTKDLISWTTMITCYARNKQYTEALIVFNEMKNQDINPDEMTMATVISACAHIGALDLGKEIHLYVLQNGFALDSYLGSALIDMYAKCGSLDRSLVVFFKLQDKNLFCWNSVIDGLAFHGHAYEALAMFSRMERENITPNGVTFVSVLSACTHAGLVDEGRRRFLSMTNDYSICLEIQHYGCMVDLFCKAGLLEDALELIQSMEIEPNSIIWGALLGGCKLHKNLDIAQIVVNKLMILEPNNSGYYNLLVNMYAEANRWSEVANIRSIMKVYGVGKTSPGSSWIELDNKIDVFAASDKSHPCLDKIYAVLGELDKQLKLVGCQTEFHFA
ncbi:pentatricopeptide repeat-containing protein At1g06143 [Diospyros lotus]|uniref:pentatricopeptide repeat-containing protein At1g06143 n=1 Tax=Diospyros lotus TaxID=55363 RepID=UPI00225BCD31|nr:pentatricopeptide repeat-containing protein At1g06143 [Diospyros lotus]